MSDVHEPTPDSHEPTPDIYESPPEVYGRPPGTYAFPLPTYNNKVSMDLSDPTNQYLAALQQRSLDYVAHLQRLGDAMRGVGEEYRNWHVETSNELFGIRSPESRIRRKNEREVRPLDEREMVEGICGEHGGDVGHGEVYVECDRSVEERLAEGGLRDDGVVNWVALDMMYE
jgi:hypothetical protein